LEAVEAALSGDGEDEAAADVYDITLADGVYEGRAQGFGGELVLAVTIEGGKISKIEVVESQETPFIADPAFAEMLPAIVAAQGLVDGVSGATVTSGAILEAVEAALSGDGEGEAAADVYDIALEDGVYEGRAQGFGGELVLAVTIEGGKISKIEVVESQETPFIADPAFAEMLPAIVAAQGPVDGVSGATVTSGAILEAVEAALSSDGEDEAVTDVYDIALEDGVYEGRAQGFGGELVLAVTIEGGKISKIDVVESQETPFIADPAFDTMLPAIVAAQGLVDGVSGATVTSGAILEAVEAALSSDGEDEAAADVYDITLADGVYEGRAQGFGGELVLAVTIEGGKIAEIEVVESQETPFIADPAFAEMLPAIVAAQGPVDGVSGATVTSGAILEAVEAALSGDGEGEAAADVYDIALEDGVYEGRAQGFGGELVLAVTIEGGKISKIEVVESQETPFIADPAFDTMLPAIVAAQGPVDGVSGATVTSGAILEAVRDALAIEEGR
jgi:uncharacterized protein with FMN-binding domain